MSIPPKARRAAMAAGGLVLLALAGWYGWQRFEASRKPAESYVYATVHRGDIEDLVSATGSLQPRDYVDVGAQVSGQLKKILVEVGHEVKEGQLLAEIDAEQSQARVDASRAQLRSQGAQLAEKELALDKAGRDLQRQKNLMAEDASTAELLQNAETTLRAARAQIDSLKAQMEQLRASMRVEESNLRFTKVVAPMSGTVVSITARQGQTLNTNQSAPIILRVADLSTMTVQTQVSEADVGKLRTGMPAYFTTLGSQQQRRWTGNLRKVEPTPVVTNNVVLYNALFDVPNDRRALLPQMTAQVFFIAAQAKDAVLVPMSALALERNRGAAASVPSSAAAPASAASGARGARGGPRKVTIKVAPEGGEVQDREIVIGISNRIQAQVISGLAEGERVVAGIKVPDAPKRDASAPQGIGQQGLGQQGGLGTGAPRR